jgi:hypothetical protein
MGEGAGAATIVRADDRSEPFPSFLSGNGRTVSYPDTCQPDTVNGMAQRPRGRGIWLNPPLGTPLANSTVARAGDRREGIEQNSKQEG